MQLQRTVLATFGLVAALAAGGAAAQPTTDPAAEARAWLGRIHDAASARNYQGTQVFTARGVVSSIRILHYVDGAQRYERVDMLDGQARHTFRHNDTVYTVWPQRQVAVIEPRDPLPSFPALLHAGDARLADSYDVRIVGSERMAGHEALVLAIRPLDRLRFAQRLWADKHSALLLRAEVIDDGQEVLESTAFTEVAIGVRPQPEVVLQPMKRLDGYRVVRPVVTPTQLENEGWAMKSQVHGFRRVGCVKRYIDRSDDDGRPERSDVLQAVFSDGLTHVSVFIEPYNPQRHKHFGHTAIGATHTLMQRHGDWFFTAVGDVPTRTLTKFVKALERVK